MATTPSIKVVKTFDHKGNSLYRWSNTYHFNGGTPADASHWHTLMDNVTAAEKALFDTRVVIVEAFGYAAGSAVPVASKTYSLAGTIGGTGIRCQSEVVALLRWSTTARTSKNHPIYLFNYFHGALSQTGTPGWNLVDSTQKSAISTYAAAWISGFSDGSITAVRAGPNGATATGHFEEEYLTHRDFPYSPSA